MSNYSPEQKQKRFSQKLIPLIILILGNLAVAQNLEYKAAFTGLKSYERIGYALGPVGDVNADGIDDFLIGTFHNSTRGSDAGAAYLILGRKTCDWGKSFSLDSADARFLGRNDYDAVGVSVAGGGDLNGDGIDDMVIGAPAGNDEVPENPGHVFIVFGKQSADWGDGLILERNADVNLYGELAWGDTTYVGGLAGQDVVIIDDLNNDGYDELLVSAPYLDTYKKDGGKVYLIPGRADWPEYVALIDMAVATFICNRKGEVQLGFSLTALGDMNDDGIPDFGIGAPVASRAYIFFGRKSMDWGFDFDAEYADVTLRGSRARDLTGFQIAGLGDVNGDGLNDVATSAIYSDDGGHDAGRVDVVFGRGNSWPDEIDLSEADATFLGETSADMAGWSISGIGDYNGDGLNDLIIGMYDESHSRPGKAYFIPGQTGEWPKDQNLGEVENIFTGEAAGDLTGFCVSDAGDINGDGQDDFMVAMPYNSDFRQYSGKIAVFVNRCRSFEISGKLINHYTQSASENVNLNLVSGKTQTVTVAPTGDFLFEGWENTNYELKPVATDVNSAKSFVNAYDAAIVARAILGLDTLEQVEQIVADVDLDSKLTLLDAAYILQYSLGKSSVAEMGIGDWIFMPTSRSYKSLSAALENQNFTQIIFGNADGKWNSQNGLAKISSNKIFAEAEKLSIPVIFNSDLPLLAFNINLKYNSNELEFVEVDLASLESEFTIDENAETPGEIRIGGFSAEYIEKSGLVGEVVFRLKNSQLNENQEIDLSIQLNNEPIYQMQTEVALNNESRIPGEFHLSQNYPNPFNSTTMFKYSLPREADVDIRIYNSLGEEILSRITEPQQAGEHRFFWNGKNTAGQTMPSGVYFLRFCTENFMQIRKCVLIN